MQPVAANSRDRDAERAGVKIDLAAEDRQAQVAHPMRAPRAAVAAGNEVRAPLIVRTLAWYLRQKCPDCVTGVRVSGVDIKAGL